MLGDKSPRVCSGCRHQHADDDPVVNPALELGVIVEVSQRENKNTSFFKKEAPKYLFAVKTKERELWLAADDAHEKSVWVNAIAGAILSLRKLAAKAASPVATTALVSGTTKLDADADADMPSGSMQSEIDYSAIAVLDKIGDGAFGEVYKGRLWGTDVAVKIIKADQVTESVVDDLKKEVAILSQLRHQNSGMAASGLRPLCNIPHCCLP